MRGSGLALVDLQLSTTSLVVEADGPKAVTIDPHGGHMWATVWATVVTDRIANKQTRTV